MSRRREPEEFFDRVLLKVKRQDDPEDIPYWERFEVPGEPGMTVAQALRAVREHPVTAEGQPTTPVVWDCSCEEALCGSCAMRIDGKADLACRRRVEECARPIVLEPLEKFPIVRDLAVDRSRMFAELERACCWTPIDDLSDRDALPGMRSQALAAEMAGCSMCGLCLEACPQVNPRSAFAGAFLFAQVLLLGDHEVGARGKGPRLARMAGRGGVADCGFAQNCEAVCPRGIALVKAGVRVAGDIVATSAGQFLRG